jgi:CBS domain-containing protein
MSLQEFCHRQVISVSPESNIVQACHLMGKNNIGCLVVEERGKMCGILTDRDVALKVSGKSKDPQKNRVREIMSYSPVRIPVDKDVRELVSLMKTHHVRRVPIVDGVDEVLGIVTMDDVIALISGEMLELGQAVSDSFASANA